MRRLAIMAVFSAWAVFLLPGASFALDLTLKDAVEAALKENLSIYEAEALRKAARGGEGAARGEFDPALKLELSSSREKTEAATLFASPEQRQSGYGLSIGGKLLTGTAYELKWSTQRVQMTENPFLILNPYYTSALRLTLSQPLLKGRGRTAQGSSIDTAQKGREIAALSALERAAEVIMETNDAYWNLYFARKSLEVEELSLRLAENILEEVKARVQAGVLAAVEIYNAEAETAVRQERLLRAKKAAADAEDSLRGVMNYRDWQEELHPVDSPQRPQEPEPPQEYLDAAFRLRRDWRQAVLELEQKRILSGFHKNQKLPELNLMAGGGLNGLDEAHGDALKDIPSGDFASWQVGLVFQVPLGNRAASGRYVRAKQEEEASRLRVEALRQGITIEVREASRALKLASESVAATEKTRVASEKRLLAEEARFRLGMTTLNDVLRFQEDYTKALTSEKRALTDYSKAAVRLRKTSGTLLPD